MKAKLNSNKNKFIPVSIPHVSREDIKSINKVLKNGWISSDGPEVKIFENKFSKKVNRKHSIAVSNGTAALEIAIKALGIKKNDEVIIPNFTIISNALAVIKQNAKPVLVDCDLKTWNIKIDDIEKKINKKTKAIIVTHIYSFTNDMDKILKICKKHKIFLIEDAAEVLGLRYKSKACGSFGDLSTFSFYANKQVTCGEGGMISTNNFTLYQKCKSLRNLCFGDIQRFNHSDVGWNYRMTNIQATLGISQLKRLNHIVKKKMDIGNYYFQRLSKNTNIYMTPPKISYSKNIYWVVGILIKNKKIQASKIIKKLKDYGIGARPFFWPMHNQDIFKKMKIFSKKKYPNASYLSEYGFYIPSYLKLKNSEMNYIISVINKLI
ncbi:DegT/DnrJ/EryC1/StrS family aminotransferase [Candidatus Pelagibacter sp.]|nr:DegT/DnrJ/EryC1/StrS family aminotransferase [Candidatus Pelagibacter sp.]